MIRPDIKRAVAILWRQMTLQERRAFIGRLDDDLRLVKPATTPDKLLSDLEMTDIIKGWPQVIANVGDEQRGFALSIMKKRGNPEWWPSEAQAEVMRRLWKDRALDGDGDVTE
jgi:hypothetical protein